MGVASLRPKSFCLGCVAGGDCGRTDAGSAGEAANTVLRCSSRRRFKATARAVDRWLSSPKIARRHDSLVRDSAKSRSSSSILKWRYGRAAMSPPVSLSRRRLSPIASPARAVERVSPEGLRPIVRRVDDPACFFLAYCREAGAKPLQFPCPAIISLSLLPAFEIFNQLAHVVIATVFEVRPVRRCEVCNIG